MPLSLRQTIAERQATIDSTFITGSPKNITALKQREIAHQDLINLQYIETQMNAGTAEPTVALSSDGPVVLPIGIVLTDADPSLFDGTTVEFVALGAAGGADAHALKALIDCKIEFGGGAKIEATNGTHELTLDILWEGDGVPGGAMQLGFQISNEESANTPSFQTFPEFSLPMKAGNTLKMTAVTDSPSQTWTVLQAFMRMRIVPYGV